jgi:hypothetical protein
VRAVRQALVVSVSALVFVLGARAGRAEEGGTGHYVPGANASFIDALPGHEGFAVANYFLYYPASVAAQLPVAGLIAANLNATAYADSIVGVYQTPLHLLGGSYAIGAIVSAIWMSADATVTAGSNTRNASEDASGLGDVLLYPLMIGWTAAGGDLKYDFRVGVYAPTGKYEAGSIVNVGKNYWTFEPTFTISFLSSKIGLEASGFFGLDLNTRNKTTDYLTGEQLHADATLAQHLPLLGGFAGLGASAFYYQQISGDSGSGAKLGEFKGRTIGVGPVVSYAMKFDGAQGAVEVKWLPELEVKNRLKGSYLWVKVGAVF